MLKRIVILAVFGVLAAHATTSDALNFNLSDNTANFYDGQSRTVGWGFTPSVDIVVTALGVYDPTGTGSGNSHEVGIWSLGGGTLITFLTVSGGTEIGAFRFLDLSTPVTLLAGTEYVIGSTIDENGEGWTWTPISFGAGVDPSNITYANILTFDSSSFFACCGVGFTYPSARDSIRPQFLGPNFQFEVGIPEPAAALLLAIGLALIALRLNRAPRNSAAPGRTDR